jgi:hypothetical protein
MEAAAALRSGAGSDEALRRAKSAASFSGPMRRNLVTMLDQIGLAETLGIATTDDLFGSAHSLASHMSALAFPVLESTLPVRTRGERRFGLPTCCLRRRGGRGA